MSKALQEATGRPRELEAGHDAAECERITRAHARTFSLASILLPREKRRAAYALYAFCRVADDLVDQAGANGVPGRIALLRRELRSYETALRDALDGRPSGAIFREVAWVTRRFDVPPAPLFELLDGVARDLETTRYANWPELEQYCEGVASSVGEMCTHVFGVSGSDATRETAVPYARTLGVAMQLTNILRDVGEDAKRGRCYLPADDLARFGLSVDAVLDGAALGGLALARDRRWKQLMQYEISRARALYEAAMPGIGMLARDAQRCAAACARGYEGILGAIEARDYDTLRGRARMGGLARAGILWDAWRYRALPADPSSLADGPRVVWNPANHPPVRDDLVRLA